MITFILVNLHSLLIGQMAKIVDANKEFGAIVTYNIDKLFTKFKVQHHKLLGSIYWISVDSASMIFVYSFPYAIIKIFQHSKFGDHYSKCSDF